VPDAQRAARVEGCAALSAFVSKSGKTGVGVSVAVRGRGSDGGPCRVEIAQAHLELAGADIAPIPAKTLGAPVEVAAGQVAYIYVPFAFDNNAMWNAHIRDGAFVFTPVVDGHRAVPWRIPATHRLDGYHTSRDGYHTPRDRARSAEPQPDIPAIAQ
jgi:hypothetical protein